MIGYLHDVLRSLPLIIAKMSEYAKPFNEKNNELMSLRIDGEKLFAKYRTIWTDIKDFKNIELNPLSVSDDKSIKPKIRTYGHKPYTIFRGFNVPEDGVEYDLLHLFLCILY